MGYYFCFLLNIKINKKIIFLVTPDFDESCYRIKIVVIDHILSYNWYMCACNAMHLILVVGYIFLNLRYVVMYRALRRNCNCKLVIASITDKTRFNLPREMQQ